MNNLAQNYLNFSDEVLEVRWPLAPGPAAAAPRPAAARAAAPGPAAAGSASAL